jgi:hypothetical protein
MKKLITLCGKRNLGYELTKPCIQSWKHFQDIDQIIIIDDGSELTQKDLKKYDLEQYKLICGREHENYINDFLAPYESLRKIRLLNVTWRKLIDPTILFRDQELIVIDTDVFVVNPVLFPKIDVDYAFMFEGIPAYRGKPLFPLHYDLVCSLNAGLVWYKTKLIDFDFLEKLVAKYLLPVKDHWWTLQSAWAACAGKTSNKFYFSGRQVRVFPGIWKRSPVEVKNNTLKYIGKNKPIEKEDDAKEFLSGADIIHFAGDGKKWFNFFYNKLFIETSDENKIPASLELMHAKKATSIQKLLIASRLLYRELRR